MPPVRLTQRTAVLATVAGLTAVATLLRFSIAAQGGLWRDEALFLAIVRFPSWQAVLDFLRTSESHPPLFYAMMRVWLGLAGDTNASALALVAILGGLVVPLMYWVGLQLYSRRVGLCAAAVAAFSPALIEQSTAVRPYSLLPLLVLASSYELTKALHSGNRKAWVLYIVFATAMLYTHNWTWLVGLGQFVAVALWGLRDVRRRRGRLIEASAAALIIVALYSPWLSTLFDQASAEGHAPLVIHTIGQAIALLGAFVLFGLQSTILSAVGKPNAVWFGITVVVSVMAALVVMRAPFFRQRSAVLDPRARDEGVSKLASRVLLTISLTAFGAAVLLSTRSMLVLPWCIAMLAPGVLLAAVAWVMAVWDRSRDAGTTGQSALVAAVVVMIVGGYGAGIRHLMVTDRSNAREVAAAIAKQAAPSDLIIIAPQWLAPSFNSYFTGSNQQIDYPSLRREQTVSFSGLTSRMASPEVFAHTQRLIGETRRAKRRVWLISDAFNIEPLSAADERDLFKEPARVGNVRVSQIRSLLTSTFGQPVARIDAKRRPVRLEEVVGLLFTPPGDSAASNH